MGGDYGDKQSLKVLTAIDMGHLRTPNLSTIVKRKKGEVMGKSPDENENTADSTPKFFDVNLSNWENLTYEQRMQIADNIYSGFLRTSQGNQVKKPIPSNDL